MLFGLFTVLSSVWLVVLYNKGVNLDHELSSMKSEFSDIQAQNLAIKSKIFDLINSPDPSSIGDLVQEKNPEYVEVRQTWSFASDY
ncbi:MAG: hypothetical protein A3B25_00300 [Candidatus Ryanbacteria bacterium RIFCSPLOWO2_01_FULL_48_26]|uniref:Uncharacterized protein n=1 Tax=Candidatus Ryanbacteria bacterium RIFCSPLOWO2_01_FULL_48_26 TaxID=1802126 RepID=A0A1G2GR43_9BACT|nr:MAG: hypothetical protein A3B25_00300 [Candidatus Ryanbacteria bacterium RIFCSPLOWO2_01_FULL_48_26]